MHLTVRIGDREVLVPHGQQFYFGRDPGPGQLTTERSVSGRHGLVEAVENNWQVTSLGSLFSFTVYDVETPSRLFIPIGSGPVPVPFAEAIVAIEILDQRYVFGVSTTGVRGWADSWRSVRDMPHPLHGDSRDVEPPPARSSGHTTEMVWRPDQFRDRRGNLRRWYQVLVAMCEPRLRLPAETREERVPSNKQIANRLGISDRTLEKHLDELRQNFGFDTYTDQMRIAAVAIALSQRLVTVSDLAILDAADQP